VSIINDIESCKSVIKSNKVEKKYGVRNLVVVRSEYRRQRCQSKKGKHSLSITKIREGLCACVRVCVSVCLSERKV
jgi:predicted metal-binding protein